MNTDIFVKELSKKYGKDERVIRAITNSPFLFTKRIMMSLEDDRPIRIHKFGMFIPRSYRGKYTIHLMLLRNIANRLYSIYDDKGTSESTREGIRLCLYVMLEELNKKGYGENEQFIQYLIKWKDRIEAGGIGDSPIRQNMGEGQNQDEGSSHDGD